MKQTLYFKSDPLLLIRRIMDIHAENLEGKDTKAIQFARYEYLRTMTDDELVSILTKLADDQGIKTITFENWENDCSYLFQYIYESKRYKALEFQFNKSGYGETGMGVIDTQDDTFYHCSFGKHWETLKSIMDLKYPHLSNVLDVLYLNQKLNEYDGVTRKELDAIITSQFEFTGENKSIREYL